MLKVLAWIGKGLLALVLLVAGVWALSRLMPMPKAQREALALMQQSAPPAGRNAFEAMWLLAYEGIPETEKAALVAADAQRVAEHSRLPSDDTAIADRLSRQAQGRYPRVVEAEPFCRWGADDCLAKVRQDIAGAERALQGQQALLQRIGQLSGFDHYRSPLPPDASAPLPEWSLLQRALAAHALAHAQGRSDEALSGICNDTRTAKMLMSRSDGVIPAALGAHMVAGNVQLLGDVLAELPLGQPLPAACEGVFVAPAPEALSLCPAMRGEFASVAHAMRISGTLAPLVFDREKTLGRTALMMQGACTAETAAGIAADQPTQVRSSMLGVRRLECVANWMGCILSSISGPAHGRRGLDMQDAGASLRLAEGLLWLRAQPDANTDAAAALARMPVRLREGTRPLQLDDGHARLQVTAYADSGNQAISLPLPASALPR